MSLEYKLRGVNFNRDKANLQQLLIWQGKIKMNINHISRLSQQGYITCIRQENNLFYLTIHVNKRPYLTIVTYTGILQQDACWHIINSHGKFLENDSVLFCQSIWTYSAWTEACGFTEKIQFSVLVNITTFSVLYHHVHLRILLVWGSGL